MLGLDLFLVLIAMILAVLAFFFEDRRLTAGAVIALAIAMAVGHAVRF